MFLERVETALEQVKADGHALVWYSSGSTKPFRGYALAKHDDCVVLSWDSAATDLLDYVDKIDGYDGYDGLYMALNEYERLIYVHPVVKVRNFYKALDMSRDTVTKSFIHILDDRVLCVCEAV